MVPENPVSFKPLPLPWLKQLADYSDIPIKMFPKNHQLKIEKKTWLNGRQPGHL